MNTKSVLIYMCITLVYSTIMSTHTYKETTYDCSLQYTFFLALC